MMEKESERERDLPVGDALGRRGIQRGVESVSTLVRAQRARRLKQWAGTFSIYLDSDPSKDVSATYEDSILVQNEVMGFQFLSTI